MAVRPAVDTYDLFPPMVKAEFAGWVAPETGTGGFETSHGAGYRYTYVPDDYFEALASGSQHPEAHLLDIDFGRVCTSLLLL